MGEAKHIDADPGLPGPLRLLRAADRRVQQVEVAVCLLAFLLMIGLAFAQVFLRTFRTPGGLEPVGWFDIIARHLVIWVGMLGASLATAEGRHISVEVLPKLLTDAGRKRLDVFLSLVSAAVVSAMLALSVIYMARVQLPSESELFVVEALGHLKVFRWPFLVIVPIGLLVIVWRLLLRAAESLVMTTAQFHEREAALEREVQERERAQEADGAALLVEADRVAAAESGRPAALTPEAAKDELRRLASGRAEQAPTEPRPAGVPGTETERLPKAGPLSPRPATPEEGPRAVPGRSTDEIPVYRDLGDDEDLLEPDARTTDSQDGLEPRVDAAEDAVEAVADTARLRNTHADDEAGDADEGEADPPAGETARMAAPPTGPAEDIDHVPERHGTTVRMPGSDRVEAEPGPDQPPPGAAP